MKKTILTLCIALAACLSAWAEKPVKLENLIRQYKTQEGFEVVTMGRLGLAMVRSAAALSGDLDEEDRAALRIFRGVRKLTIVDFEAAEPSVKEHFTRKVDKILRGMELVMEMTDDGETVRIYGTEDSDSIKDCILYSSDGAIVCVSGSLDIAGLESLMKMEQ